MDWSHRLLFVALLITSAAIHGAQADAMVSGTVFCDQCKDGHRSLFDYPIYGMKVSITCADSNGQITMSREETTNLFGNYVMKFDGSPDLSNCLAQVSSSSSGSGQGPTGCALGGGPAQTPRLMFKMFDMEMYSVDSLLTQPAQPMSFCPKSSNPVSPPATPTTPPPQAPVTAQPRPPSPVTPPPRSTSPVTPPSKSPSPVTPPSKSPSPVRLPPMPRFPPLPPLPPLPPMPPMPFVEASACPHQSWTRPEYKCYWKVLSRDMKVAVVFGPIAGRRYGNDMTLWQGLQGRGDPYRTLLREATTALLNSYNSLQFTYNPVSVVTHMNYALMASQRGVLLTALRFTRANSGSGNVTCKFTTCK